MRVFITGATGSIGVAVTAELAAHGHQITALARSDASAAHLLALRHKVVRGDLRAPSQWADAVLDADAVVNLGDTFTDDMDVVDHGVIEAMRAAAAAADRIVRLIYTGGCWMYGATGDKVANEDSPFNTIAAFEWANRSAAMILSSSTFAATVLHPAMVYHQGGGVFERFLTSAKAGAPAELWGTPQTRWPLIHRNDLAVAYRLLVETPDLTGHYNASAEPGVAVGDIVTAIYAHYGRTPDIRLRSLSSAVTEHGDWAEGPFLDQQMACPRLEKATGWWPAIPDFRASDLFGAL